MRLLTPPNMYTTSFKVKQFYTCLQSVSVWFVRFLEQTAIIYLNFINDLMFARKTYCFFFEVENEFLNTVLLRRVSDISE
jgi:hypothetical protein